MAELSIQEIIAGIKARDEAFWAARKEEEAKRAASVSKYQLQSKAIAEELPKNISYNPSATNWLFSLSGKRMTDEAYMAGLTNIPNTLVASGHGAPAPPGITSGLSPDVTVTNKISQLIRDRKVTVDDNFKGLVDHLREVGGGTGGGIILAEISKGIGNQTNEVKRVVLMSCFAAGYTPEDIRKYFPNAVQIIAPGANEKFASIDSFNDLFRREASKEKPTEISPYVSNFYSYTPTKTNEIKKASDWLNPIPDWLKYK